uniref:rab3 GTPase-activating protein non-catalytic subunit-like n=1 Tax=Myxine glutinosa TaxID=7769 RepID=UPI00358E2FD6
MCTLSEFCQFQDIQAVQDFLFQQTSKEDVKRKDTEHLSWEEDWGSWDDSELTQQPFSQAAMVCVREEENLVDGGNIIKTQSEFWLQDCILSLSPTNNLLVIAYEERAVFLQPKWKPNEKGKEELKYTIAWSGFLNVEEREYVSSVLCIPLASQKRSSTGHPDWTCIVVGFTSGYVRFYTETGVLLLSQLLNEGPVLKLKCRTYDVPRHAGIAEQHEEVSILYPSALVTIDGFSLYQSLRACRNQVAKATAVGTEAIQPPPLAYKKWGLQDMEGIMDHISVGIITPCPFDQMKVASVLGGYNATIKSSSPAMAQYVTVGTGPFTSFFYALEWSSQPLLSHVALAVASKLTSAFLTAASGWLGWKGRQVADPQQKQKPKMEPATALPVRFGLPDSRRCGESITLSPCNTLAAITDEFGRVTILDLQRGLAVRMWKGYRDAQVGWIQVTEESGDSDSHGSLQPSEPRHCRVAQFLVIYAPRRGILEVWSTQQGPRVAAFNVGKNCRLLYAGYRILGLNNVTCQGWLPHTYQCCLVEPSSCKMRTINVPFHLSLSDKKSEQTKELHLLKRIRSLLKVEDFSLEANGKELQQLLLDIKHPLFKKQGIEHVLNSNYLPVPFLLTILNVLLDTLHAPDTPCIDENLLLYCQSQKVLLTLYTTLTQLDTTAKKQEMDLATLLGLEEDGLNAILSVLETYHQILINTNSTTEPLQVTANPPPVSLLLGCLGYDKNGMRVRKVDELQALKLGHLFFWRGLCGDVSVPETCSALETSRCDPEQLAGLLLLIWLSREKDILENPSMTCQLFHFLSLLSRMQGFESKDQDPQAVLPFWEQLRGGCQQSHAVGAVYLAAQAGCVAAQSLANSHTTTLEEENAVDPWEAVSLDGEQWNLLLRQAKDILQLNTLFLCCTSKPCHSETSTTTSIKELLEGGRGSIADCVARWAMHLWLPPAMLQISKDGNENGDEVKDSIQQEFEHITAPLKMVLMSFPFSLEPDMLHSHCSWANVVQWNKDPEETRFIERAVDHLARICNPHIQHGLYSISCNSEHFYKLDKT